MAKKSSSKNETSSTTTLESQLRQLADVVGSSETSARIVRADIQIEGVHSRTDMAHLYQGIGRISSPDPNTPNLDLTQTFSGLQLQMRSAIDHVSDILAELKSLLSPNDYRPWKEVFEYLTSKGFDGKVAGNVMRDLVIDDSTNWTVEKINGRKYFRRLG